MQKCNSNAFCLSSKNARSMCILTVLGSRYMENYPLASNAVHIYSMSYKEGISCLCVQYKVIYMV